MTSTLLKPQAPPGTDRRWLVLVVMCFTVLIISLDQTVMNVAIPTLVRDLHPSSAGVQWIVDSYTLATAVFLMFGGALGDRFGRRRIFLVGVAIFGAGSLGCALVHSATALIIMRAIMGFGSALLMPATLSIIAATYQGRARAQAIGTWAGISGIGASAGPLLGGWLLQHFWWGSIFLINVPIAVVAFLGCWFFVVEGRADNPTRLDPVGVVLSSLGLTLITFALIQAPSEGWTSPLIVGTILGGLVLVSAFVVWSNQSDEPMLDLRLFRNRVFSSALGSVTAVFFANFAVSYLLSQYLQFVLGYDAFQVGLRLLPSAIGMLVSANLATRIAHRVGLRRTMVTGMGLAACAQAILATTSSGTGYLQIGLAYGLMGFGTGLTVAPASNAIVGTLPKDQMGAGSGLRATVQLLGASFGVAVIGSVVISRYRDVIEAAFSGPLKAVPSNLRPTISSQVGAAHAVAGQLPASLGHTTTQLANHAFAAGIRTGSIISLCVILVAMVAAARYVPRYTAHLDDDGEEILLAAATAA